MINNLSDGLCLCLQQKDHSKHVQVSRAVTEELMAYNEIICKRITIVT